MDLQLQNALIVRRLLQHAEHLTRRKADPTAKSPTLKEDIEAEKKLLDGSHGIKDPIQRSNSSISSPDSQESRGKFEVEQEQINLRQLINRLKDLENRPLRNPSQKEPEVVISERRTIEWEVDLESLAPVEGLVVRSQQLAETDRYRFDFSSGTELTITDKWTRKSTRIWGDPHLDLNDMEGENNGDFRDLTASDSHTTFLLRDSTRLTITARDDGVIEEVDIFKGTQHVRGKGAGSKDWSEQTAYFNPTVLSDGASSMAMVNLGDIVYEGGDGNDWYNSTGRMVWGQISGPEITQKPGLLLNVNMRTTYQASFQLEA